MAIADCELIAGSNNQNYGESEALTVVHSGRRPVLLNYTLTSLLGSTKHSGRLADVKPLVKIGKGHFGSSPFLYLFVRRAAHRAKIGWMWNAVLKFFRLPLELKRFVLLSVLILPMTYAGLKLFGFKRLLRRIQNVGPLAGHVPARCPEDIHTYTHLFSAVARRLPLPLKCLGRSVALCWLLRLRGMDATVHIGVRKEHNGLGAHAWVQIGDFVINDAENAGERYTRVIPTYSGMDRVG